MNPPPVEHLHGGSPERMAILENYWNNAPMDFLAIHLKGYEGIAVKRGREYPYWIKEANACRAIFSKRNQSQ